MIFTLCVCDCRWDEWISSITSEHLPSIVLNLLPVSHWRNRWSTKNVLRQDNVHASCNQPVSEKVIWCVSLVCLFWSHPSLPMIPVCDLSPSPTQSHVHFLWGQRHVPESCWLRSSGPVSGLRHTEPPQRPTSWRLQHQRDRGSGGQVEPGLTLLSPLHHNVRVRSHSLTLTFPVICVYQWRPLPSLTASCVPPTAAWHTDHTLSYLTVVREFILAQIFDLDKNVYEYSFLSLFWKQDFYKLELT